MDVKAGPFSDAQTAAIAYFQKLIDTVHDRRERPNIYVLPVDEEDIFSRDITSQRKTGTPIFDNLLERKNLTTGEPRDTVAVLRVSTYTNPEKFTTVLKTMRAMRYKRIVVLQILIRDDTETAQFRSLLLSNEVAIPFYTTPPGSETIQEINLVGLAMMEIALQL